MSSASRKLTRRMQQSAPQDISGKLSQVLQVGQQLADVSLQVNQVNEQLKNLDELVGEVKAARGLLEEIMVEQSRQRYATLAMFKHLNPATDYEALERHFRAEFDNAPRGETTL